MGKLILMPALAFAGASGENLPTKSSFSNSNVMFYGPGPGGPGGPYGGPGGPYGGPGGPFGHGPGGFGGPGGRSIGGRLYHGPHDPGLPGAGYNSLEPKKAGHDKKPNVFVRIRDWWYFHTHEF